MTRLGARLRNQWRGIFHRSRMGEELEEELSAYFEGGRRGARCRRTSSRFYVPNEERKVVMRGQGAKRGSVLPGGIGLGFILLGMASPASAQATEKRTAQQIQASFDAHKGEFDYLLGDWEFSAESREQGTFQGYWSAVRLDEGQILDEYRVVGDKGETYYRTATLRNYNGALDRWELVGAEAGRGLQDVGTARREGAEMRIEQTFGVAAGTPSVWRIRYYDIRPDRFSWTADRSTDGGQNWEKNHMQLEARRIGPARFLDPLAPARKPGGAQSK